MELDLGINRKKKFVYYIDRNSATIILLLCAMSLQDIGSHGSPRFPVLPNFFLSVIYPKYCSDINLLKIAR